MKVRMDERGGMLACLPAGSATVSYLSLSLPLVGQPVPAPTVISPRCIFLISAAAVLSRVKSSPMERAGD